MKQVFSFLNELQQNNNREWFNTHKKDYETAKNKVERLGEALILSISAFDKDLSKANIKDCLFRIYRDTRFSHDKTPYKTHFGMYMAFPGGRKSQRGGYYLHLQPNGQSFFSAGIWMPEPSVLKILRQNIYDNYEEFDKIRNEPEFKEIYNNSFYQEDKLQRLPAGFPADFPDPEILKLKHYVVSYDLDEKEITESDFIGRITSLAQKAYPLLRFLNYAVDEANV